MEQHATVKREFLIDRQGKQFVLYAGLLDLAHSQGLRAIRTRLVQVPSEDNNQVAIVAAEVETERGLFSGIGDASPANVSRAMLTATIRLAETRAKARALRDAVNVGVAALEETGEEEPDHLPPAVRQMAGANVRPAVTVQPPTGIAPPVQNGDGISDNQRKAVFAIMKSLNADAEWIEGECHSRFGVKVSQLSKSQASEFIGALKEMQGAAR